MVLSRFVWSTSITHVVKCNVGVLQWTNVSFCFYVDLYLFWDFFYVFRDITMLRWKRIGWLLMTIAGMRVCSLASEDWPIGIFYCDGFQQSFKHLMWIKIYASFHFIGVNGTNFCLWFSKKPNRFYALQFINPPPPPQKNLECSMEILLSSLFCLLK